jgi:hypothetical protein
MEKLTQCDKILRHLTDYGSITSLTAVNEYGILRLAARISDLKRRGHEIDSRIVIGKNRYQEATHYTEYTLRSKEVRACRIEL